MAKKVCSKCGIEKDVSEFHTAKRNKDGLRGWCRGCVRDYAQSHKEENRASARKNYPKHKERRCKYLNEYNKRPYVQEKRREKRQTEESKEYFRKYTKTEKYKKKIREYRKEHIDEIRPKELARERRYRKIPERRILGALRARLGVILKRSNGSISDKFIDIIGCTYVFLRQHLESQWKEGMSWNNYGKGRSDWVIDHIKPCASFDLTDPKQQRECFNYKNLQPLWWHENASKSDKI